MQGGLTTSTSTGSGSGNGGGGTGSGSGINLPVFVESSGAQLLLEFYAGEDGSGGSIANNTEIHTGLICTGGFLANVEQIGRLFLEKLLKC